MPQSFDPNTLTLDDASRLVAIQAVLSVGHEKQAVDVGRSALIGGGVGLGTGLLASALSKRKKKRWLRNAILGSLLGAGVGASGAAGKNWWDQRQAPGIREQPRDYNDGGIETPESVQRRLNTAGDGEQMTPQTYQDEAGLSPNAETNLGLATGVGMPAVGGMVGMEAGRRLDRAVDSRQMRSAVRTNQPASLFGPKPEGVDADMANELRKLKVQDQQQSFIRQNANSRNPLSRANRTARRPLQVSDGLRDVLQKGTPQRPGYRPSSIRPRVGGIGGKLGGGLAGAGVGALGHYLFGRDLTNAYRNTGTALSSGVN